MKFLKILFCGGLVSFLGCAGSGSTAGHNDADDIRARAELAYSELDNVALSSSSSISQDAELPLQTVVDSRFSLVELLQSSTCPDDDLRGVGIAGDASTALVLAQKDIAVQIQSVVVARIEDVRRSDVDANGNELVQSSYEAKTQVLARLQNAQDAKPIATLNAGDKFHDDEVIAKANECLGDADLYVGHTVEVGAEKSQCFTAPQTMTIEHLLKTSIYHQL